MNPEYIAHYGVKGMKWGQRKADLPGSSRTSSGSSSSSSSGSSSSSSSGDLSDGSGPEAGKSVFNRKNATIFLGSALAIGAVTAGGIYLANNPQMLKSLSEIGKAKDAINKGEKMAQALAKEPTSVVHFSRAKHKPLSFLLAGDLADPGVEIARSPLNKWFEANVRGTFIERYGDNLEKIAAIFPDPEGRKDFAGRGISHAVILPKEVAKGVSDINDAPNVAWSLIKDNYQAVWEAGLNPNF